MIQNDFIAVISNGEGKYYYFAPLLIIKEYLTGNKSKFDVMSHTSLANINGISSKEESNWNRWRFDPFKKVLKIHHNQFGSKDDSGLFIEELVNIFKQYDISVLKNIYELLNSVYLRKNKKGV